jgi:hypothetical protein
LEQVLHSLPEQAAHTARIYDYDSDGTAHAESWGILSQHLELYASSNDGLRVPWSSPLEHEDPNAQDPPDSAEDLMDNIRWQWIEPSLDFHSYSSIQLPMLFANPEERMWDPTYKSPLSRALTFFKACAITDDRLIGKPQTFPFSRCPDTVSFVGYFPDAVKRPNAFKQYSLDARVQMLRFGDFVQEKEEPSVLLESWSLRILPFTVQMERGPSSPSL